jgi:hypothetical protein
VRSSYAALPHQAEVKPYATDIQGAQNVPIQTNFCLSSRELVLQCVGSNLLGKRHP